MSEAGLRAWIGEVERKLRTHTRVMLALAAIAIGGAGAAVYVAVEAQDQAVSEADVQALQQRLEARIGEGGAAAGTGAIARLESELRALREQVGEPKGAGGATGKGAGSSGPSGTSGPSGGATGKGAGSGSEAGKSGEGTGGASTGPTGKLGELLERIKKQGSK